MNSCILNFLFFFFSNQITRNCLQWEGVQKKTYHFHLVSGEDYVKGNALELASFKGHIEIAKLLMRMMDNTAINSAFYWALAGGHLELTKLFIEGGANPIEPLINPNIGNRLTGEQIANMLFPKNGIRDFSSITPKDITDALHKVLHFSYERFILTSYCSSHKK